MALTLTYLREIRFNARYYNGRVKGNKGTEKLRMFLVVFVNFLCMSHNTALDG